MPFNYGIVNYGAGGTTFPQIVRRRRVLLAGDSLVESTHAGIQNIISGSISNGVVSVTLGSTAATLQGNKITVRGTDVDALNQATYTITSRSGAVITFAAPWIANTPSIGNASGDTGRIIPLTCLSDTSFYPWLNRLGNFQFELAGSIGGNGRTTDQILQVLKNLLYSNRLPAFDYLFLMCGSNDYGVSGADPNYTTSRQQQIIDIVKGYNGIPILFSPPPINDVAGGWSQTWPEAINNIRNWQINVAKNDPYIEFVDTYRYLSDNNSTHGNWKAGQSVDALHWNTLGSFNGAVNIVKDLALQFPIVGTIGNANISDDKGVSAASCNALSNPCSTGSQAAGAGATGTVGAGWTGLGNGAPTGCVFSLVARSDGLGNDVQCVFTSSGSGSTMFLQSPGFKANLIEGQAYRLGFEWLFTQNTGLQYLQMMAVDGGGSIVAQGVFNVGTNTAYGDLAGYAKPLYIISEPWTFFGANHGGNDITIRVVAACLANGNTFTCKMGNFWIRPYTG
jgi:GDSL-like Lipase/Acylhydrolase family